MASSPPNSMITSVSGAFFSAATFVAYTSCTKSTEQLSAIPIPADPEITREKGVLSENTSRTFTRASTVFAVIWEKCRSYAEYTILPPSSNTIVFMVVEPTSNPIFKIFTPKNLKSTAAILFPCRRQSARLFFQAKQPLLYHIIMLYHESRNSARIPCIFYFIFISNFISIFFFMLRTLHSTK